MSAHDLRKLSHVPLPPITPPEPEGFPLRAVPIRELLDRPDKPFTVKGLFGPGDLVMIYGKSGVGKSLIVIDLIVRMAAQLPLFGRHDVKRPLNCLYWSSEGRYGIPARLRGALEAHDLGHEGEHMGRICICTDGVPSVSQFEQLDQYITELKDKEGWSPDVIALDTLTDVMADATDEHSNKDAAKAMRGLADIGARHESTIFLPHHVNKGGETYSGPHQYEAKCDLMLHVDEGVIKCTKAKDIERPAPVRFEIYHPDLSNRSDVAVRWAEGASKPNDTERTKQDIVQAVPIGQDNALGAEAIHAQMEAPPSIQTVRKWLRAMREDSTCVVKVVHSPTTDKNGKPNKDAFRYYKALEDAG